MEHGMMYMGASMLTVVNREKRKAHVLFLFMMQNLRLFPTLEIH